VSVDELNAGADASFDWSPRNVNVCCWLWLLMPLELEAEELPLLDA
jgi:hypothetical protein